jgi:hypothetical protein
MTARDNFKDSITPVLLLLLLGTALAASGGPPDRTTDGVAATDAAPTVQPVHAKFEISLRR